MLVAPAIQRPILRADPQGAAAVRRHTSHPARRIGQWCAPRIASAANQQSVLRRPPEHALGVLANRLYSDEREFALNSFHLHSALADAIQATPAGAYPK